MAWTRSGWHGSWITLSGYTTASSNAALDHALRAALYDNSRTPNGASNIIGSSATTPGYANAQWAGGETASAPGWPGGGVTIPGGLTAVAAPGLVRVDGADVASAGPVTLNNPPYGDMIYDPEATISTAPRLSLCFHYFGGPVTVQNGTLTIHWAATGVAVITIPVTPPPGGP